MAPAWADLEGVESALASAANFCRLSGSLHRLKMVHAQYVIFPLLQKFWVVGGAGDRQFRRLFFSLHNFAQLIFGIFIVSMVPQAKIITGEQKRYVLWGFPTIAAAAPDDRKKNIP